MGHQHPMLEIGGEMDLVVKLDDLVDSVERPVQYIKGFKPFWMETNDDAFSLLLGNIAFYCTVFTLAYRFICGCIF